MIHFRCRIIEQIILLLAVIAFAFLRSCPFRLEREANIVLPTARFAEVDEGWFAFLADSEDMRLLDIIEVEEGGDFC